MNRYILLILIGLMSYPACFSQNKLWYTQGSFAPALRIEYMVENTLSVDRENCPVIIPRNGFPMPDLHEMWVTVVDPQLSSSPEPSDELLTLQGGHQLRKESNGHAVFHQLDDIDKDGIWDELFFMTDLKAREKRTFYIYIGENSRGWNKHGTHAAIGSYCRHIMPFWENEYVGWKIWFANSCDVFAKRKPMLMSYRLYMDNIDGYGVSNVDPDYGSDIQRVAESFGGGSLCLFEFPEKPELASRPRFTPVREKLAPKSLWNAGQMSDTRYAYDVVYNGPVRSMVKIKGMNWDSGNGFYEYEQYYTIYAGTNYCLSKVVFTNFLPRKTGVLPGCGVRKKPEEDNFFQKDGLLITSGPEYITDPENIDNRPPWRVPFIGMALAVKQQYKPAYQYVPSDVGNHTFRINTSDVNNSYEYMVMASWSEGPRYNDKKSFNEYAQKMYAEYNNPVGIKYVNTEEKAK